MFRVLVVLSALAGCATGPTCPVYHPPMAARPLLWRVTAPNGPGSMVILATHQGVGADAIPDLAWTELEHAETFVAEADEMPAGLDVRESPFRPLFFLPKGASLERMLVSDDFDALASHLGTSSEVTNELRPWLALMMLGRSAYSFAGPSINEVLVEHAKDRAIALRVSRDLGRPASLSRRGDHAGEACRRGSRIWPDGLFDRDAGRCVSAGDDAQFANEIASPDEPVVTRIVRWTARLHELLYRGDRSFVALGIGQLFGPYGVLVKLEALGYRVERL